MFEILANPLRLGLHATQMASGHLDQLQLLAGYSLFDIGVGYLFEIEFRAVAGQVEHLYRVGTFGQSGFYRFTVMHAQMAHNQEELLGRAPEHPLYEVNEDGCVQCAFENSPAHLSLVGHARDHRQPMALVVDPCSSRWVVVNKLLFERCRRLLVGLFHRLLGRKSPTLRILAHCAHLQHDP